MEKIEKVELALMRLELAYAVNGLIAKANKIFGLRFKLSRIKNNPPALRAWGRKAKEIIRSL